MPPPNSPRATSTAFFAALDCIERGRVTLAALRTLRDGYAGDRRALARRLLLYAPQTRLLLALLRPNLTPAAAQASGGAALRGVMAWVRLGGRAAFLQLTKSAADVRDGLRAHGDDLLAAWCALENFPGQTASDWVPRGQAALAAMTLLRAERGEGADELLERAAHGDPTALRALALLPAADAPHAPRVLETLLIAHRAGTRPVARAAADALAALAARTGLTVDELARRVDLAAAWPDAGFEGQSARVWPVAPYTVRLQVRNGRPAVSVHTERGALRAVPAAVRRSPAFAEVRAAADEVRAIARRFAARFEAAMAAQEPFGERALKVLRANPIVADVCDRLVWQAGEEFGVFEAGVLRDVDGRALDGRDTPDLRTAHPASLAACGLLTPWQHRLQSREVRQPFPQVFREVYAPTECGEVYECRFAGRVLLARRAYALLRARGWAPGSGCARRDWPAAGVRACLVWALERRAGRAARTAAGVVMTGPLYFERVTADESREVAAPIPVAEVLGFVVSEALRDFDLVVARAGYGEAEFSAHETPRFRGALLRDLARLHGLPSIVVGDGDHALIEAPAGRLRLHLGTGVVHREPDGRQVPAATPRGQQVLPVTANGPETADILALALALARGESPSR